MEFIHHVLCHLPFRVVKTHWTASMKCNVSLSRCWKKFVFIKPAVKTYRLTLQRQPSCTVRRVRLKPDGTRWRTVGEVKGKLANGVGSQYSDTTSERGVSSITTADAHTSTASSRLNWRPRRFKRTSPFRRKTKSGFCACAITFQTHSTTNSSYAASLGAPYVRQYI